MKSYLEILGSLLDTGATFRAGASSLRSGSLSHGFTFVYMIPHKMPCVRESPRREFTPVVVPGRKFHSGTKSRTGIM